MQSNPSFDEPDTDFGVESEWLQQELQCQAAQLTRLHRTSENTCPASPFAHPVPSVYELRERVLLHRTRHAKRLSYASSGLVVLLAVGWGLESFVRNHNESAGSSDSGLNKSGLVRSVSENASLNPASENDRLRMIARWWEAVPVEWVDDQGHAIGVAGFVVQQRQSPIDPSTLSRDELLRLRDAIRGDHSDPVRDQFVSSMEPAF